MKKIDFHIHTVSTASDWDFEFCLDKLKEYVTSCELDAIAITNHNMFDKEQFIEIKNSLSINVYPGIEIDVEGTHILLISDDTELVDFKERCDKVSEDIPDENSAIEVERLREIFSDLSKYILIPHYKKKPQVQQGTVKKLHDVITAGEVCSPKKFVQSIKDEDIVVPVFFSDIRIDKNLKKFPSRQTYIDVGEITLESLKLAFKDKMKVYLTSEEGHKFFSVNNYLQLSTGLNVVLGERSTGKSFTLDLINKEFSTEDSRVKYIEQFSLLQKDKDDEEIFTNQIRTSQSRITSEYLKEFESVVEEMKDVSIQDSYRCLDRFIQSLHKHASESHKRDTYANARLFVESSFSLGSLEPLARLISSTINLIENVEFKDIVDRHVDHESLKQLVISLISKYNELAELRLKKSYINGIVEEIQNQLKLHTAATPIQDTDLYSHMIDLKKVDKFNELFLILKDPVEFRRREVEGFFKVASRQPFINASDVKKVLGKKDSYKLAFAKYSVDGYSYLKELRKIPSVEEVDYFKLFVRIDYNILNSKGFPVSGGERSEFRLLQEISDASEFDLLLIDEPESSFDNVFLYNKVNKLIKDISSQMPVVLVTHNSTVGASIKPDYLVYTNRMTVNDDVVYRVFTGYPGDKTLKAQGGEETENHKVLLNCLEAGDEPYLERRRSYEVLKD